MDEKWVDEKGPFFEISFPECQLLICPQNEVWEFIQESLEYLEGEDKITIKACNLTREELLAIPEHNGC